MGDGWLGSFLTPDEAAAARATIEEAARAAGREIEADHYGTNVTVALPGIDEDRISASLRRAVRQRRDLDPELLLARGWDGAREQIRRFVEGGLTKFVIRPAGPVPDWAEFLRQFRAELGPLES